jgi:hypothetical protein
MAGIGFTCACGRLRASTKVSYEGFDEPNYLCDACYIMHCYVEKVPYGGKILRYSEAVEKEEAMLRLHREGIAYTPPAPPPTRKKGRKVEALYHIQMRPGISLRELSELMGYATAVPLRKHTTQMIKDELIELRVEKSNGVRSYRYYSLVE